MWGPIIGAAIQGGAGLLGGMFGSQGAAATNAQTIGAEEAMQQQSESWMEHMSDTAYQRGMADMKAAGLNPILAANLGGASTPGIGIPNISLANPGSFMQQGITSAGQVGQTYSNMKAALTQADKDASQVDVNKSTVEYNDASTALTHGLNEKAAQDTRTSAAQEYLNSKAAEAHDASANLDRVRTAIANHDVTTAYQKSRVAAAEAENMEKYGPGAPGHTVATIKRTGGTLLDYGSKAIGAISDAFTRGDAPTRTNSGRKF